MLSCDKTTKRDLDAPIEKLNFVLDYLILFEYFREKDSFNLCSHRDSNPGCGRERAVSLASRLWELSHDKRKSLLNLAVYFIILEFL